MSFGTRSDSCSPSLHVGLGQAPLAVCKRIVTQLELKIMAFELNKLEGVKKDVVCVATIMGITSDTGRRGIYY